jgi:hypothetical protein
MACLTLSNRLLLLRLLMLHLAGVLLLLLLRLHTAHLGWVLLL